jgi:hypothetical protein
MQKNFRWIRKWNFVAPPRTQDPGGGGRKWKFLNAGTYWGRNSGMKRTKSDARKPGRLTIELKRPCHEKDGITA